MRYYIILQPTIRSMGGEEMYTRNKVNSARERGYTPLVFHNGGGEKIYVDELKVYEKYEFQEFRYEPCVISKGKKKRLLERIKSILEDYDEESIIESHEMLIAEWGEFVAKALGIRHFAYMLLEHNTITYKPLYDFFKFKYNRRELAGIIRDTIPDMFCEFTNDVEGYSLPAYCTNVYENIPCPDKFKIVNGYCTIGSIGRTNKAYVQPMIDAVLKFVGRNSDKMYNFLYIGGSMDKTSEQLVIKRLSAIPNLKLTFTGMLFPIPVSLIKQMDVCLASAGSCRVSANCGIPTISIDANDNKAIGIVNVTTNHSLFRDNHEPPIEIDDALEDVLIKKICTKEDKLELINIDFSSHWIFVEQMASEKEYYDISQINYPLKRKLISLFLGYYYGLPTNSTRHRLIEKCISLLKK